MSEIKSQPFLQKKETILMVKIKLAALPLKLYTKIKMCSGKVFWLAQVNKGGDLIITIFSVGQQIWSKSGIAVIGINDTQ